MPRAKKPTKTAKQQGFTEFDATLPGVNGMMTALNPVAAKAVSDAMSESATFFAERLQATMTFQQNLMTCTSPSEVISAQTAYTEETLSACAEAMARFTTLMTSSVDAMAKDAKDGHRRAYNDVPV